MFISAKWAASAQKIKGYNNKYVREKPSPIYFTEKQLNILDGEIPFEEIAIREYDFLVAKLIKVGRISDSERIREMKERKLKDQEIAKHEAEDEARNARVLWCSSNNYCRGCGIGSRAQVWNTGTSTACRLNVSSENQLARFLFSESERTDAQWAANLPWL